MNEIHYDKTRMQRSRELTELNPYWHDENDQQLMVWKPHFEIQQWVYDQGYDCGIDELWKVIPSCIEEEIGHLAVAEGIEDAEMRLEEEVNKCAEIAMDERIGSYVDGQMRLYAGYDVAENGDTLEEGEYSTYEELHCVLELGIEDRLRNRKRYSSIE